MTSDDEAKPWTKRFVPAERWVLPARRPSRRTDDDEPGSSDAAKRGFTKATPSEADEVGKQRAANESAESAERKRVVVQAGFGLCVSFVLAACGGPDKHPPTIGPELGSTHVSQAPIDPTVPPPDAPDYEQPSPGFEITPPGGPPPNQPAPSQSPAPPPAQPGVFSPPPPGSGPADVPQPEIPKP